MRIKYDKDIDAKYIKLLEKKPRVVKTEKVEKWIFVDYDKDNRLVGVEVLNASMYPGTLFIANGKVIFTPLNRKAAEENFVSFREEFDHADSQSPAFAAV